MSTPAGSAHEEQQPVQANRLEASLSSADQRIAEEMVATHKSLEVAINPEYDAARYQALLEVLDGYQKVKGLKGRADRGLDPAGMLAVLECRKKVEQVAMALGAKMSDVEELTAALHVGGIWKNADRLSSAEEPAVLMWMVLAEATTSGKESERDFTPGEFLKDVDRVNTLLSEAVKDSKGFAARSKKNQVELAAKRFEMKDGVPFSREDGGFLAMAIQGKKAGIVQDNNGLLFVGSNAFQYDVLIALGLHEEKKPDARRGGETSFWVDPEGKEVVKVLYPGFAIVFGNRMDVAKAILKSIPKAEQSKQDLGKDSDFIKPGATAKSVNQIKWGPVRRAYGAVPGIENLEQHLTELQIDKGYFEKNGKKLNEQEMNALLLYRLKFGKPLSELTEAILRHYPNKGGEGKFISLFGLSGSGKSLAIEAFRENYGDRVVAIDSDTTRMNLFGKVIKDLEMQHGADFKEVRNQLIHNAISGPMYTALAYVEAELKKRGYFVVQSATGMDRNADEIYYLDHREIDPRNIPVPQTRDEAPKPEFTAAVQKLTELTNKRCPEEDTYDWEHAEQITDFHAMKDVAVKVPSFVHGIFIGNVQKELRENPNVTVLTNPENPDRAAVKKALISQMRSVSSAIKTLD